MPSEFDERSWQPRSRAIQEAPHALCFSSLHCNEPQLTADMVDVGKQIGKLFIGIGIAFEPRDPDLNGSMKARADFKAFVGGAVEDHGGLRGQILSG